MKITYTSGEWFIVMAQDAANKLQLSGELQGLNVVLDDKSLELTVTIATATYPNEKAN